MSSPLARRRVIGRVCPGADGGQILLWMGKAFVAAGDVLVHFDAEGTAFLGAFREARGR